MFGKLTENAKKKGEFHYLEKEMKFFGKGCFFRCFGMSFAYDNAAHICKGNQTKTIYMTKLFCDI